MLRFEHIKIKTIGWLFVIGLVLLGALALIASLNISYKSTTVKASWNKFQQTHSEKTHALNALRAELGHAMDMQTIAEFVENDEILEKLREIGVDYAQGYGIGRPEPLDFIGKNEPNIKLVVG